MPGNVQPYIQSCPVGCQSDLVISDICPPEGPLKKCSYCGHLISQCTEKTYWDSMKEFNSSEGTWPHGKASKRLLRHTKQMLNWMSRLLDKKSDEIRLLDIGCSTGAFISAAQHFGVHVEGVEPASAPANTAKKFGLKVHHGYLQDLQLTKESFDVLTLFEVLEHLKNPVDLLRECKRILKKRGLLLIRTGNAASWSAQYMKGHWEYFSITRHGGHISFFNPVSMIKLAERTGFQVERFRTHRVCFYQKGDIPETLYRAVKFLAELLNTPSIWFGKGHELQVFLRKHL